MVLACVVSLWLLPCGSRCGARLASAPSLRRMVSRARRRPPSWLAPCRSRRRGICRLGPPWLALHDLAKVAGREPDPASVQVERYLPPISACPQRALGHLCESKMSEDLCSFSRGEDLGKVNLCGGEMNAWWQLWMISSNSESSSRRSSCLRARRLKERTNQLPQVGELTLVL
jgi:hypothetical protein